MSDRTYGMQIYVMFTESAFGHRLRRGHWHWRRGACQCFSIP